MVPVSCRRRSWLVADLADQTTLTAQLSAAFANRTAPQTARDPGRVLTDLAVMIASPGGEAIPNHGGCACRR
jgi:hypothetical protein